MNKVHLENINYFTQDQMAYHQPFILHLLPKVCLDVSLKLKTLRQEQRLANIDVNGGESSDSTPVFATVQQFQADYDLEIYQGEHLIFCKTFTAHGTQERVLFTDLATNGNAQELDIATLLSKTVAYTLIDLLDAGVIAEKELFGTQGEPYQVLIAFGSQVANLIMQRLTAISHQQFALMRFHLQLLQAGVSVPFSTLKQGHLFDYPFIHQFYQAMKTKSPYLFLHVGKRCYLSTAVGYLTQDDATGDYHFFADTAFLP